MKWIDLFFPMRDEEKDLDDVTAARVSWSFLGALWLCFGVVFGAISGMGISKLIADGIYPSAEGFLIFHYNAAGIFAGFAGWAGLLFGAVAICLGLFLIGEANDKNSEWIKRASEA